MSNVLHKNNKIYKHLEVVIQDLGEDQPNRCWLYITEQDINSVANRSFYDIELKVKMQDPTVGLTDDEYNNWVEEDLSTSSTALTYSGDTLDALIKEHANGVDLPKDKNFKIRGIWIATLKDEFLKGSKSDIPKAVQETEE